MTKSRKKTEGKRRLALAFSLAALAVCASAFNSSLAVAAPPLLSQFCEQGEGGGQCNGVLGVASDPITGNVYVVSNNRVNVFTIWAEFIRAFGGGVVNGGAAGTGVLEPGSTKVTSVSTTSKEFVIGMPIEGTGMSAGSRVVDIGFQTLTLSQPATTAATGSPTALSSPEAPGNVSTNELQEVTVTATGGSFRLRFLVPAPDQSSEDTADIPYNASAAQVQAALEGLSSIGSGDIEVSSPNPGGEPGVSGGPYTVEFKGARFADTNVRGLIVKNGVPPLSGGEVEVAPVRQGASAPEVCTAADCRLGVDGNRAGQFATPSGIAVDSQGDLYVYDSPGCTGGDSCVDTFAYPPYGNHRIQKFDSEGNFLLMFGGDVNEGGGTPSNPGDVCTAEHIANGDVCGGGKGGIGNGEFGFEPGAGLDPGGDFIDIGPDDTVYVGGRGRIQEFESSGAFKSLLPDPDSVLTGEVVQSLAVDQASGSLYVTFDNTGFGLETKENVRKLASTGKSLAVLPATGPTALATDNNSNLYVVDGVETLSRVPQVLKYEPNGTLDSDFTFEDGLSSSRAIATSSTCGIDGSELYVSNLNSPSYVRAYGPPPDAILCPPPAVPPTIQDQYAISADAKGATLKATINPNFWTDATYYVEYGVGKCSDGGCGQQQPLAPGSKLTTATTNDPVTTVGVFLEDLDPATTYHYRFVAQSSGGGPVRGVGGEVGNDGAEGTFSTFAPPPAPNTDCPNQAFRTSAAAKLPDCRAYEMVSPVDKNNGDITTPKSNFLEGVGERKILTRIIQATPGGDAVTYSAQRSFAGAPSSAGSTQYVANRDSQGGWSTHAISPPRNGHSLYFALGEELPFKGFSEDLCSAWLLEDSGLALTEGAPPAVPNLYRRDTCGEEGWELLTSVSPPGYSAETEPTRSKYVPYPQGWSEDGTRTVFRANAKLTSRACDTKGIFQIYESVGEGVLRLVSALPNGSGACTHASAGTAMVNVADPYRDSVRQAVSGDATRVYWTLTENSDPEEGDNVVPGVGPGEIYLRLNADQPQSTVSGGECKQPERACTIAVSGPDSTFWGASPDGTTALYETGKTLYEFDLESESSLPIAEGVLGQLGMSDDASRVYFVSTEVLTGKEANSEGDIAKAGAPNVYLHTRGDEPTFVATLAPNEDNGGSGSYISSFNPRPHGRAARVTPDGMHAAFMSEASLTGYDNKDVASGEPDAEVYLYDAGSDELTCVSCNPSGSRPSGRLVGSHEDRNFWMASRIPGWESHFQPTRVLSDDGSRLFFESFDALVLSDTNGVQDVYEWEASGSGDCSEESASFSESNGGCVSLISSGESPEESEFLDASADGRDVFFTTSASLLPQDTGLIDIYDAREGGGFPPPPAPPAACEGEACQGPLSPPDDPTPASSSFEGAGNVAEGTRPKSRCAKGKIRRKGRCVTRKQRKRASHNRRTAR